jgi:hypothetical protein
MEIIDALSSTLAMYALAQISTQLRFDLAEHRPKLKLFCVKMVFSLSLYQSV